MFDIDWFVECVHVANGLFAIRQGCELLLGGAVITFVLLHTF
jgi:hypothetical protein